MSIVETWDGFDYRTGKAVTWPRSQWRDLIRAAHRRKRVKSDQSLLLFDRIHDTDRIVLEVYDRDPSPGPSVSAEQHLPQGQQS